MTVKNYYATLGVKQSDSEETIKQAYRKLAKQYHPDLNPGDKTAEAKMREIGEAWEVLGDGEKRKKHDNELSGGSKKKPFTAGASTAPQSGRPMTQEDFYNATKNFDNMFSQEAIKNSVKQRGASKASPNDPLNTTAFFEQVLGFKGPKKK